MVIIQFCFTTLNILNYTLNNLEKNQNSDFVNLIFFLKMICFRSSIKWQSVVFLKKIIYNIIFTWKFLLCFVRAHVKELCRPLKCKKYNFVQIFTNLANVEQIVLKFI